MTPIERRLAALRQELDALANAPLTSAEEAVLGRATDELEAVVRLLAEPAVPAPFAEVEVSLAPEPSPPQVVRLDVTGCAGADRLVVVVDLGMGSPNRRAGWGEVEAWQEARRLLANFEHARTDGVVVLISELAEADHPATP